MVSQSITDSLQVISPADAPALVRQAVSELASYLAAMGVDVKAAVYVGIWPPHTPDRIRDLGKELPADGFLIETVGESPVLIGGSPRGTLYAVYAFLEKMGVVWHAPGQEYIPSFSGPLPMLHIFEVPAFERRGLAIDWSSFAARDLARFAIRNRLNVLACHPIIDPSEIAPTASLLTELGLDFEVETHALHFLLPRSLFEEHPDYFRTDASGQRTPDGNMDSGNLEALRTLREETARLVAHFPQSIRRYYLWQDDGAYWCQSGESGALSPSDQTLRAMNVMLSAIREHSPQVKLAYLAYMDTIEPPVQVRPERGIFLEFAPINRCYFHSVDDPACDLNRRHWEKLPALMDIFEAQEGHILEYWLDLSMFSRWQRPFVRLPELIDVLQMDMKAYRRHGFRSATTFAVGLSADYFRRFSALSVYLYTKLLWNPNLDVEKAVADFCHAAGTEAASHREMESLSRSILKAWSHGVPFSDSSHFTRSEDLTGLISLYERLCPDT